MHHNVTATHTKQDCHVSVCQCHVHCLTLQLLQSSVINQHASVSKSGISWGIYNRPVKMMCLIMNIKYKMKLTTLNRVAPFSKIHSSTCSTWQSEYPSANDCCLIALSTVSFNPVMQTKRSSEDTHRRALDHVNSHVQTISNKVNPRLWKSML